MQRSGCKLSDSSRSIKWCFSRVLHEYHNGKQVLPHLALSYWPQDWLFGMTWIRATDSWGMPLFGVMAPWACLPVLLSCWPHGLQENMTSPSGQLAQQQQKLLSKHPLCIVGCVHVLWIIRNLSHWMGRAKWNRAVFVEVARTLCPVWSTCISVEVLWRALGGSAVCAAMGTEQSSLQAENNQMFLPWL